jgi:hypothetical protein
MVLGSVRVRSKNTVLPRVCLRNSISLLSRVCLRTAGILALAVVVTPAFGATTTVLFPRSLHLVRRIDDSLAKAPVTLDEYCAGNRTITIHGSHVTVVDYDQQTVTEIDHAAGTYSITRFDEIAKAQQPRLRAKLTTSATGAAGAPAPHWKQTELGMKSSSAGRSVDSYELVAGSEREKKRIEIGVDRQISLTRGAAEVLVGAAYPSIHTEDHDAMLGAMASRKTLRIGANAAAGAASAADESYGLPSEQLVTYESEGVKQTMHSSILRVGAEAPPNDALLIDPGATRVESRLTKTAKELDQLDRLPNRSDSPR